MVFGPLIQKIVAIPGTALPLAVVYLLGFQAPIEGTRIAIVSRVTVRVVLGCQVPIEGAPIGTGIRARVKTRVPGSRFPSTLSSTQEPHCP